MSITGGHDPVPDRVRVTDDDRDEVVARLQDAIGKGALQFEEVEERLEVVYRATTQAELDALVSDLPEPMPELPQKSNLAALRSPAFQMHLVIYAMVNLFLIGVWAVSGGGMFWPFFPIGGWGIAIVAHFMAANAYENHREQREARRRHKARKHRPSSDEVSHELKQAVKQWTEQAKQAAMGAAAKQLSDHARKLEGHSGSSDRGQRGSQGDRTRRFVVAMFVDIVDSTRLNEAMGDDAWAAERERFRTQATACFRAQDGWEVSAAGDGILARFNDPGAAVRAAIALQEQLASRRDSQFTPSVRIGIHSGDVIDEGDDIVGSVINLASRVSDASDPGEILITEHVADHLDSNVKTDGRGLHNLKGIAQPRHLLAVKW